VSASYVINASGPWVDDLDKLDSEDQGNKLQLTKGVHLVFDHQKLPVKEAIYVDTFDKRMIFILPHRGKTYVGTTDTFFDGDKKNPSVNNDDKNYLLRCINGYFNTTPLKLPDIESSWAGIRPLIKATGKKPSEISRRDETFEWESGLISIAGGKLTGYRKMAQRVVDLVAKKLSSRQENKLPACDTENIFLSGGKMGFQNFSEFLAVKTSEAQESGLTSQETSTLVHRYGSEIDRVLMLVPKSNQQDNYDLPSLLYAQLVYAIEHEMCLTPLDFFIRRTGMMYFDIAAVSKYKSAVFSYMKNTFNWDATQLQQHEQNFDQSYLEATKVV
jgi:glycerol-3-phosphate dehydrogenase